MMANSPLLYADLSELGAEYAERMQMTPSHEKPLLCYDYLFCDTGSSHMRKEPTLYELHPTSGLTV